MARPADPQIKLSRDRPGLLANPCELDDRSAFAELTTPSSDRVSLKFTYVGVSLCSMRPKTISVRDQDADLYRYFDRMAEACKDECIGHRPSLSQLIAAAMRDYVRHFGDVGNGLYVMPLAGVPFIDDDDKEEEERDREARENASSILSHGGSFWYLTIRGEGAGHMAFWDRDWLRKVEPYDVVGATFTARRIIMRCIRRERAATRSIPSSQ